jgi:hypothetical protein
MHVKPRTGIVLTVITIILMYHPVSYAGTWGEGKWGTMYWGDNLETPPILAPSNLSIESGPGIFIISFDFDSSNGNDGWSVIDQYVITCTNILDESDQISVSTATKSLTIENLDPGAEYECVALARNDLGEGPSSAGIQAEALKTGRLSTWLIHTSLCNKDPSREKCN